MTKEQVLAMASAIGLHIPDDEVDAVAIRLGALLAAMDAIEADLGSEMDKVDPVPPVFG